MDPEPQLATLPSGLRVLHLRLPGATAIGASLGIDVGSADEPDDWAGISHFLEHLVFRGTAGYADSVAVGTAIEAVGGDFNAFTGKSATQYICAAPLAARSLVVNIPAELAVRPLFRTDDVDDERPVVLREIGLEDDNAGRRMVRALEQASWPGSPMARPVIGRQETLARITAEDVRRYWRAHYRPSRAVFALAGDLPLEDALELIEHAIGAWSGAGEEPPPATPPVGDGDGPVRLEVMEGREESVIAVGAPVGPWRALDHAGLAVLATLLGEGEGSLVARSLVRRRGLLLHGGALAWLNRDAGVLGVAGSARPARVEAAIRALRSAIDAMSRAIPADEFRRAMGYARGDILRQWQRPLDVAIQLCQQALLGETRFGPAHELALLDRVTPERVRALAAEVFAPAQLCLAVAGPRIDVGTLRRALVPRAK